MASRGESSEAKGRIHRIFDMMEDQIIVAMIETKSIKGKNRNTKKKKNLQKLCKEL